MSKEVLSDKVILEAYDFTDYTDPVVSSIHEWEQSGEAWVRSLRFLYNAIVNQRPVRAARHQHTAAGIHYVDMFEAAATTVALDGPRVPERTVKAIEGLLLHEEESRRRQLSTWYDPSLIPPPDMCYVRGLAHAYGDPESLLPHTTIPPPDLARISFLAQLENKTYSMLGELQFGQHMHELSRAQKVGRKAFGQYQPKTI